MLKINIICVGSLKEKFFIDAINEYSKRLSRFVNLKIVELPQCKIDEKNATLKFEEQKIIEACEGYVVLLDIKGEQFSSEALASTIKKLEVNGQSTISFVIGGSFGVSEEVRKKANMRLSFSSLTFPHQLFRVMLLEQIYRAFTIINNMPYHK